MINVVAIISKTALHDSYVMVILRHWCLSETSPRPRRKRVSLLTQNIAFLKISHSCIVFSIDAAYRQHTMHATWHETCTRSVKVIHGSALFQSIWTPERLDATSFRFCTPFCSDYTNFFEYDPRDKDTSLYSISHCDYLNDARLKYYLRWRLPSDKHAHKRRHALPSFSVNYLF